MSDLDLTIKQVIDKYSFLHNKSKAKFLGQHFLCDFGLLRKIAICAAPFDDCDVVEIGPGPCGLTRAILDVTSETNRVFCVEKDEAFKEAHSNIKNIFQDRLTFFYADALHIKLKEITTKEVIVVSNLPYNVGTQIVLKLLFSEVGIKKMILMFQKEVAERICASVGTKAYGRLSIVAQLFCDVEMLFDVSNKAFCPPPKIQSAVVKMVLRNAVDRHCMIAVDGLANVCFQKRRKTIFGILKKYYNHELLEEALRCCFIDKMDRPEEVSPEKFLRLSVMLGKSC